jgi:uncharacterized membrane protein YkvI
MREFANWISTTAPSQYLQENYAWSIPGIQSIHIIAIGILMGSIFLINLRVLGWAGRDQSLVTTTQRYAPWMWGSLVVLTISGIAMIVSEPARELLSLSFWVKMVLLAIGILVAIAFQISLRRNAAAWETSLVSRGRVRTAAVVTFLIWCAVAVMGRMIAFDAPFWGSLAPGNLI